MPGSDRRQRGEKEGRHQGGGEKQARHRVGNGERKKAATRAAARSRRVIGSRVRRSGDRGRLDETSARIRKLPVMLGLQCAG